MQPTGPNADQIQYWNDQAGAKWTAFQDRLDAQLAGPGLEMIERLAIGRGEHVMDLGCGCGATTLELARRVGANGRVVGVDISSIMLARARERVAGTGLDNVTFLDADAQTHAFAPRSTDVLFSRFGVMFFTDPPAAFSNLRNALRPAGRMGFVCWRAMELNPWIRVPALAAAAHVDLPQPVAPGSPGPFAFADDRHLRGILESARYSQIEITPFDTTMTIGGTPDLDEAASFAMQFGPTAAATRDSSPETLTKVREAVRTALAPYHTTDGVQLGAALWIVQARA